MKFVKNVLKFIVFIAVVVALAVLGIKKVKEAKAQDASLPKAKIYPIMVSTIEPKSSQVTLTLPYLAEVNNDKDVQLASRIAARVESIKPSGAKVNKGDVLVTLDKTAILSSIRSINDEMHAVQITLNNLRATHRRTLKLIRVQGASIEESQKESSQIATLRAKINALKEKKVALKNNLSYSTIVSPVSGLVSKTFVNKGAISGPGRPLIAISSQNGFYLKVRVPSELSIQGVNLDHKFYPATPLNSTFHGLEEYKVYVNNSHLISGDRVQVDVVVFNQQATLLPFDAILNRDGKGFVLVVNGNRAKPQEVHILKSAEQGVAISDNLEGKKIVVAKPDILLKLTSGYALKVEE